MRIGAKIVGFGVVGVMFFLGAKSYLGFHYFYQYGEARSRAESIERRFPELEAKIKTAVRFWGNPLFHLEMGQLYLERALAENQFGTAERRDFYLDLAKESLICAIKGNPLDAFTYFEMGKVYMLYNYPLLTYMEKAKRYFRLALELKPADEFLHENILYVYLAQWERLSEEERDFVEERVKEMDEGLVRRLQNKWKENFSDDSMLKEIFGIVDNR
jgi:hypothetical protein